MDKILSSKLKDQFFRFVFLVMFLSTALFLNSCGVKKTLVTPPSVPRVPPALQSWHQLITDNQNGSEFTKLLSVNTFFNKLQYIEDSVLWGTKDYWATPIELLEKGGGDCEDFAIAKYFTLRQMGVQEGKLRITYVIAQDRNTTKPHMVLNYYRTDIAIPLVLDSLHPAILPATQRPDLLPVYSFNGNDLWLAKKSHTEKVRSSKGLSLWQGVLHRYHAEIANLPFQ